MSLPDLANLSKQKLENIFGSISEMKEGIAQMVEGLQWNTTNGIEKLMNTIERAKLALAKWSKLLPEWVESWIAIAPENSSLTTQITKGTQAWVQSVFDGTRVDNIKKYWNGSIIKNRMDAAWV